MELFSEAFYPAVLAVLDSPQLTAFGSVPVARYGRTMPQVCCVLALRHGAEACGIGGGFLQSRSPISLPSP
jgi:hypothetical protein